MKNNKPTQVRTIHKTSDVYKHVKELYPTTYTSMFLLNDNIAEQLTKKGLKNIAKPTERLNVKYDKDDKNIVSLTVAKKQEFEIDGPYFKYVHINLYVDENKDQNMYDDFLFINKGDVQKFFKEYLKNVVAAPKRKPIEKGLYDIETSMFGCYLSKLGKLETDAPILKNNLQRNLVKEVDAFCKRKSIYDKLNLDYKRGILMYGPPGNGKTSFIKNFAQNIDAITILANLDDFDKIKFLQDFISNSQYANKLKIVVIEDIDGLSSGRRSILLNLLDGLVNIKKTIFIATTNFPERLDIAIKNRPSRFDSIHYIGCPETVERRKLLKRFFGKEIDNGMMERCVTESKGFSGAYFKEVYVYAKLNDLTPLEAIYTLKKRMNQLIDVEADTNTTKDDLSEFDEA